VRQLLK